LQEPDKPVEPIDSPACADLANGQNLTWENLDFTELRSCLLDDSDVTNYTLFVDGVCMCKHMFAHAMFNSTYY